MLKYIDDFKSRFSEGFSTDFSITKSFMKRVTTPAILVPLLATAILSSDGMRNSIYHDDFYTGDFNAPENIDKDLLEQFSNIFRQYDDIASNLYFNASINKKDLVDISNGKSGIWRSSNGDGLVIVVNSDLEIETGFDSIDVFLKSLISPMHNNESEPAYKKLKYKKFTREVNNQKSEYYHSETKYLNLISLAGLNEVQDWEIHKSLSENNLIKNEVALFLSAHEFFHSMRTDGFKAVSGVSAEGNVDAKTSSKLMVLADEALADIAAAIFMAQHLELNKREFKYFLDDLAELRSKGEEIYMDFEHSSHFVVNSLLESIDRKDNFEKLMRLDSLEDIYDFASEYTLRAHSRLCQSFKANYRNSVSERASQSQIVPHIVNYAEGELSKNELLNNDFFAVNLGVFQTFYDDHLDKGLDGIRTIVDKSDVEPSYLAVMLLSETNQIISNYDFYNNLKVSEKIIGSHSIFGKAINKINKEKEISL